MSLRTPAIVALVVVVLSTLEVVFFGSDTEGTAKHDISVICFLLSVVAFVALVLIGVVAVVRRVRTTT